jgi:heme peroxidase
MAKKATLVRETYPSRNGGMDRKVAILATLAAAVGVGVVAKRAASDGQQNGTSQATQETFDYRPAPWEQALAAAAIWLDQKVGWPNLPLPVGLAVLVGERIRLRERNLYDTDTLPSNPEPPLQAPDSTHLTARTSDGTFNDLQFPRMGSVNRRFGRNVPHEDTYPDPMPQILSPNPRDVSVQLLTRTSFHPAPSLNMLAAAWIQFMTRDWFTHGQGDKNNMWQIPLPAGDAFPQNPMLIPKTIEDPTRPADAQGAPPTHLNQQSPWWDSSQIYPPDPAMMGMIRAGSGGKLRLANDGAAVDLLPAQILDGAAELPGWWLGLGLMFTIFAREHNAICDRLAAEYPNWSDDELFARARLILAALIAKIHTVEWTPAIVAHPTTQYALPVNWYGVQGKQLSSTLGRLTGDEVISGIPGSETNHHNAPYSLTEEFVAVYRLHPLIRDEYSFRRIADDATIQNNTFDEITDHKGNALLRGVPTEELIYSFGTLFPGAVELENYPKFLQHFTRPDGKIVDLASIDVMRMRELGVPRYARFRELLHMRPVRSFEEVTTNPAWARKLRDVYEGRIDRIDLMVGMFAEPKPAGFGFSDTAFRIFILMASRRLKSDRFFTPDFTPEVYTPVGMDWINRTSMIDIMLRHYPRLRPSLRGVNNAFVPWEGSRA